MKTILKRYIPIPETEYCNCMQVEIYYTLGGYNVWNYKVDPRGFYLSITPMKHEVKNGYVSETYSAYTGLRQILLRVERRSKRAETIAVNEAAKILTPLIRQVCDKNNLPLPEEVVLHE